MFNVYIDVRSAHPTLFHGMRAFRLENFTRNVGVEQAVDFLRSTGQIEPTDPLVQITQALHYDRNN